MLIVNSYTSLRIGSLLLAVPNYEVAQINSARDIHYESGLAYIPYQIKLVPVFSIDERFSSVRHGYADFNSQYVVTLACANDEFRYDPRIAIQVESTTRIAIVNSGHIPQTMKKRKSPISSWYIDQMNNRGFMTGTMAIEAFVTRTTKVYSNDREHSTLVG